MHTTIYRHIHNCIDMMAPMKENTRAKAKKKNENNKNQTNKGAKHMGKYLIVSKSVKELNWKNVCINSSLEGVNRITGLSCI